MNLNKDPESWSRVSVAAVMHGSEAQQFNVLHMALEDIGRMAAEIERLRRCLDVSKMAMEKIIEHYPYPDINHVDYWVLAAREAQNALRALDR